MSRLHLRLLTATLAVLVIAACSQPPNEEQPPSGPEGTVHTQSGEPAMVGAALFFLDLGEPTDPEPVSVIDAGDGLYFGPVTTIAADGSFTLALPDGSELPAALMKDADGFVYNALLHPSCALSASDATVSVTSAAFELITIPGIGLLSVEGFVPGIATAEALPATPTEEDVFAARFQTWVYATGPTTVVTDPVVCDSDGQTLSVSVSLTSGWNQLEWTVVTDDMGDFAGMVLGNSTADDLHVASLYSLMSSSSEH